MARENFWYRTTGLASWATLLALFQALPLLFALLHFLGSPVGYGIKFNSSGWSNQLFMALMAFLGTLALYPIITTRKSRLRPRWHWLLYLLSQTPSLFMLAVAPHFLSIGWGLTLFMVLIAGVPLFIGLRGFALENRLTYRETANGWYPESSA